jgi:DNA replicative helicase MCM subunit Mcm2 (Cdc46/Mcm family)
MGVTDEVTPLNSRHEPTYVVVPVGLQGVIVTAEQRLILEISDVLALRVECTKCGAAVVVKPSDWRELSLDCPGCKTMWELPRVDQQTTPIQHLGLGLRQLVEQAKAGPMPYKVRIEIRDPLVAAK